MSDSVSPHPYDLFCECDACIAFYMSGQFLRVIRSAVSNHSFKCQCEVCRSQQLMSVIGDDSDDSGNSSNADESAVERSELAEEEAELRQELSSVDVFFDDNSDLDSRRL